MVKLSDLKEEQPRVDLDNLATFIRVNGKTITIDKVPRQVIELLAIGERQKDATKDSVEGVLIDLWTGRNFPNKTQVVEDKLIILDEPVTIEKGMVLTQKYSRIITTTLRKTMKSLRMTDTEQLQKSYYYYTLEPVRTGYPKLVPVQKSDKVVESPPEEFIKS